MSEQTVDTQVIANLVVRNDEGAVLLVRYDPDNEKWWLPGRDVPPFTHPDDSAVQALQDFDGLEVTGHRLSHVESFRGRRGWHLVFHYDVQAAGDPGGQHEARWFAQDAMPRTMHGQWEKQVVASVCDTSGG